MIYYSIVLCFWIAGSAIMITWATERHNKYLKVNYYFFMILIFFRSLAITQNLEKL